MSQSRDLDTLRERLVAFAEELEFPLVNAVMVYETPGKNTAQFVSVGNTPREYLEQSLDEADSRRDPVNKHLKKLSVPFIYDQALYVSNGAADLWERQAEYGYRSGICVALHLPDHRHMLLGVDREKPLPSDSTTLCRMMADLQLLAVHAQAAASSVLTPPTLAKIPKLTPRERDVLHWTMEGKSTWACGNILSISEFTVNFHLRNIYKKLNCTSKHQAIAIAIRYDLI